MKPTLSRALGALGSVSCPIKLDVPAASGLADFRISNKNIA